MSVKSKILKRVHVVLYLVYGLSLLIVYQVCRIQFYEGEIWRDESAKTTMTDTIEGMRGNIFDCNGKLLATSLTQFKVSMDPTVPGNSILESDLTDLSKLLSTAFEKGSPTDYEKKIRHARKNRNRYLPLANKVSYSQLEDMKSWPIFKEGRYGGGLIAESFNTRVRPFGRPAWRTIGTSRANAQSIGIEGSFSNQLSGPSISRVLERISGNEWVQRFDIKSDEQKGKDLVLTIDIQLQDIADRALEKALYEHKAKHGCVIVMEVETGAVKAISNLGRNKNGEFWEDYNYAVGRQTEPGSTFKMMSTLALLEEGKVGLDDHVNIKDGYAKYYDRKIIDSHPIYKDSLSLEDAFVKSSNVAISKFVNAHFGNREKLFTDYITQFGLDEPTGIEINGEPKPLVKKVGAKDWTGVTIPYMSMGYEVLLTPLQTLRFYNAIANGGEMMQPYLVESIFDQGHREKQSQPISLGRICRPENAELMRGLCTEVVERGTAKSNKSERFSMAGKTGTAKFIDYDIDKNEKVYQASFAGFFPAESPKYSAIVLVHAPKSGKIYGGDVAAPVFKEIVEKYLTQQFEISPEEIEKPRIYLTSLPEVKTGHVEDWNTIFRGINVPSINFSSEEYVNTVMEQDTVYFQNHTLQKDGVPDVVGMGIRDALFVLEQKGLRVRFKGQGKVTKQTPEPAASLDKFKTVYLELS